MRVSNQPAPCNGSLPDGKEGRYEKETLRRIGLITALVTTTAVGTARAQYYRAYPNGLPMG
jgi:hypothetical protein